MEPFVVNDYLELSEKELIYKHIFLENSYLNLDEPNTPHHIDTILDKLVSYSDGLKNPDAVSSDKEFMSETLFPKSNDVIVSKHLRYSPCFIHSHSFFEIVYILNGSCKNKISNTLITMNKGDICIIAPNTLHALSVFSDDCIAINLLVRSSTFENSFFGILKSNDILSSFFSHALYSPNTESFLLFTNQNDLHITNYVLNMYHEFNNNLKYSDRMLTSMMSSLFIYLLRTDVKNIIVPNPTGSHPDRNIIYILNYISINYKTITLKDLSLNFNYSERQMARILKEYTGKTFMNIVQDIKLQKTCELLCNPNISINTIIDTIGYSNSTHFYKLFKRIHNMTPIEYRNNYLNKITT